MGIEPTTCRSVANPLSVNDFAILLDINTAKERTNKIIPILLFILKESISHYGGVSYLLKKET